MNAGGCLTRLSSFKSACYGVLDLWFVVSIVVAQLSAVGVVCRLVVCFARSRSPSRESGNSWSF